MTGEGGRRVEANRGVRWRPRPARMPVGRFGTAAEVADPPLMLACDGYITGQTIQVNGGAYIT